MVIMMTNADLAHAIHQWIVDAYLILIGHFAALGNLVVTSVHVGECSGTMISPELYEVFVVPYISQLGDKMGDVRLHSCGFSDHLLSPASQVHNLKIIDIGTETSIKKIRKTMGNEFGINVFPPVALLLEGSPISDVYKWLDKTLAENREGPLQIAYHIEPDYDIRNILAIHEELEKRGLIFNERLY